MSDTIETALSRLQGLMPEGVEIRSPFTIPSGIVTTTPSVISRIARDIPQIGIITTKTLSVKPRSGYREPILHEYHPGCFVNAVGLANPGAEAFRDAMAPLLPLHDRKPLLASIMGEDPEEFLQCAMILDPIADAFELNFSCPHVKGAGQAVGSDPEAVRTTIKMLKSRLSKPVIPKLSPNLGDIPGMARLCENEGADALTLINTVGPGVMTDCDGAPILTNVAGGVSGAAILPLGLKAVREAAQSVDLPILACGGISTADHVRAYASAGAALFGVGSALAGMTTEEVAQYFQKLVANLQSDNMDVEESTAPRSITLTRYLKTHVKENRSIAGDMFELVLESGPFCDPGRFFFLRIPGKGEKPFSPMRDIEPRWLVRAVGPFTKALRELRPGDEIHMRGPYGKGFPCLSLSDKVILIGGGTGVAPVIMAGMRARHNVIGAYFGFSSTIEDRFRNELEDAFPHCRIAVDPPGAPGEVARTLEADLRNDPEAYKDALAFICGPNPMMNAVAKALAGIIPRDRIFAAREDIMRCGIGICGSCGTPDGLRSCIDGPVTNG